MQEKRNKPNRLLLFVIFILLISIIGFILSLNMNAFVIQEQGIPIVVKISDYPALNISKNQQELNLGTVNQGSGGQRNLNISNGYDFKTVFEFEVTGDITPLLIYPRVVIFEPLENKEIPFKTKIIENESFGVYTGIIHVKIKRIP